MVFCNVEDDGEDQEPVNVGFEKSFRSWKASELITWACARAAIQLPIFFLKVKKQGLIYNHSNAGHPGIFVVATITELFFFLGHLGNHMQTEQSKRV